MKMSQYARGALLAFCLAPTQSIAWETGQELTQVIFESVDTTGNGTLDYGEVIDMSQSIAFSMDTDANDSISFDEFLAWDFGIAYLAESEGGSDEFKVIKTVLFAVIDRDGSADINAREWRLDTRLNFERADLDNNAVLTEQELLGGWTPIVMFKTARDS